jgi:hypothetical protein
LAGVSTNIVATAFRVCNDENNSVIRSAMDALRNSKKISLIAVAILFLFTFFNLILDASAASRLAILFQYPN